MKALILAAGYATRLYPLTRDFPKPLLDVGGKPLINHLVDKMRGIKDLDDIFVVTNDKFFGKFQEWSKEAEARGGRSIRIINDRTKDNATRLGAIGDMHYSIIHEGINDDLLVIGGDNLFDGLLDDFIRFARSKGDWPSIGVFDIKSKADAGNYGVVSVEPDGRISDFQEKPEHPHSALVAMCLYYFPKARISLIVEYMRQKDIKDASGLYIKWLKEKYKVYAFVFTGKWFDIGSHEFYNTACEHFKNR